MQKVCRSINTSSTPLIILINDSRLRLHSTVGILADADAGVFTATENVTILGDLEVKATNKKVSITEKVDSLIRLQSNMELRVNGFVHHANMGVVCDPEGTEYRSRNFETVLYGWVVAYLGAITQGDGNWYWYDGTPWDFVNSVRDGMGGTSETRLAVTDEEGGKWHDWGTGDTTLGVICRLVGE
ncbi:unnamed protein product [Bathycoccus prasinos]